MNMLNHRPKCLKKQKVIPRKCGVLRGMWNKMAKWFHKNETPISAN